jgi:ABC-type transport system involved in multi-copper enzyme maturation permease subunit
MTRSPQVLWSIASVSFREIIRDKILYNILVIAVLLMGLGFLASKMTFVRPDRVIMDFGVSAVSLSLVAIGTFIGASQLNREVERRTMFLALSRPISSYQFVAGKYLGLLLVLFLNWFLVSAVFLGVLLMAGGVAQHSFSLTLFLALILLLFQSWVVASFAVFFSTFSTTSLSSVLVIGLFLVGNNVSQFHALATRIHSRFASSTVEALSILLPNLEYFNLGTKVTYGIPVPFSFILIAVGYALAVSALMVTIAGVLIRKKEA